MFVRRLGMILDIKINQLGFLKSVIWKALRLRF